MRFRLRFTFLMIFVFSFLTMGFLAQERLHAQMITGGGYSGGASAGMWGSGYWGGNQQCPYPQQIGKGAVDISDEEKEEKRLITELQKDLKKQQSEKRRYEKEMEFASKRLEKIFDTDVLDFLLKTHMDNQYQCDKYKDYAGYNCDASKGSTASQQADANQNPTSAPQTDCGSKIDVTPEKLKINWNSGKRYCNANSVSEGGKVSGAICSDESLRPADRKRSLYTSAECQKFLNDYRNNKIKADVAQAKITRAEDDIEVRRNNVADARERAKLDREDRLKNDSEAEACEDCGNSGRGYSYQKPNRDWFSIVGQIGLGLGLGMYGKKYDEAAMEYQAQLGYPPQQGYPTAIGLGFPFIAGGISEMISGIGRGAFGCAGTGLGIGNGMYGPYGPGGAFGYPQGMFGTPWGGGMYPPGMSPWGGMAGPWGGGMGGIGGGMMMSGGLMMNGMMNGGYPGMGMAGMGGIMGGGYPGMGMAGMGGIMGGGYPGMGMAGMGGMMGGYPMGGGMYPGGLMMSGGLMMNGGYPGMGGMAGGMMGGGYPGMGMAAGMGAMNPYGMAAMGAMGIGTYMNSPQWAQMQQQQMQMQQQIIQQQMQMQQQYYQAQMQAQMQAYQRQQMVAQQSMQIQQEIQQLYMRLQMIQMGGGTTGGGYYGGGTIPVGTVAPSPGSGPTSGYPTYPQPYPGQPYPYPAGQAQPYPAGQAQPYPTTPLPSGGQVTIPAPGSGGYGR